jgi:glutathione S-transferase
MVPANSLQIIGRSSSHFTRVTQIFAHELGVHFELVPVLDITAMDAASFAGNPALKIPTLRRGELVVFGSENICRTLAEISETARRIVWPEELRQAVSRNAQEMVWHGMAAQVQIVTGVLLGKLPVDHGPFAKIRAGLKGALRWLEEHSREALGALPSPRHLSLFEVTLFCLMEHLPFRGTLAVDAYPALTRFAAQFAERESAQRTPYRFDATPP